MKSIVFLLILLVAVSTFAVEIELKKIRSIGNYDEENYTFFNIKDAKMSENKDIFVMDNKGYFIAKYNWQGKFLKRTGRRGRGPSDYLLMHQLHIFNNRLYVIDPFNLRIAITGTDLDKFEYIKIDHLKYQGKIETGWPSFFWILGNNRFLGLFIIYKEERNRFCIFDGNQTIEKTFFNELPTEKSNLHTDLMIHSQTKPLVGLDSKSGLMLISFAFPDNKIRFFLYNTKGERLKSFFFEQEKSFIFPAKLYNRLGKDQNEKGEKIDFSGIDSIHSFGGYFLVYLVEYKDAEKFGPSLDDKNRQAILFFDKTGNFVHKQYMEESLHFYQITPDGIALVKDHADTEEDIERLHIFKIALKRDKK